jgi:hypothetical protein
MLLMPNPASFVLANPAATASAPRLDVKVVALNDVAAFARRLGWHDPASLKLLPKTVPLKRT